MGPAESAEIAASAIQDFWTPLIAQADQGLIYDLAGIAKTRSDTTSSLTLSIADRNAQATEDLTFNAAYYTEISADAGLQATHDKAVAANDDALDDQDVHAEVANAKQVAGAVQSMVTQEATQEQTFLDQAAGIEATEANSVTGGYVSFLTAQENAWVTTTQQWAASQSIGADLTAWSAEQLTLAGGEKTRVVTLGAAVQANQTTVSGDETTYAQLTDAANAQYLTDQVGKVTDYTDSVGDADQDEEDAADGAATTDAHAEAAATQAQAQAKASAAQTHYNDDLVSNQTAGNSTDTKNRDTANAIDDASQTYKQAYYAAELADYQANRAADLQRTNNEIDSQQLLDIKAANGVTMQTAMTNATNTLNNFTATATAAANTANAQYELTRTTSRVDHQYTYAVAAANADYNFAVAEDAATQTFAGAMQDRLTIRWRRRRERRPRRRWMG